MKHKNISGEIKEGEFLCRWLESRLIKNNKNVLGAELGATGSGKSYRDLRKMELWYLYYFNEPVPIENICFGTADIMRILSKGELRRGEILMFEEAGVNLGSLDFQNKIAKMMTYVLQSFRSMNIGIFFNLPYLSMLNKQARMLLHYSSESKGIDYKNKLNKCKFKVRQVNQSTGKVYEKFPRTIINNKLVTLKTFSYGMPSQYLIDAYEKKKHEYLQSLTKDFSKEIDKINNPLSELSEFDEDIIKRISKGEKHDNIAKDWNVTRQAVTKRSGVLRKKGFFDSYRKKNPKK